MPEDGPADPVASVRDAGEDVLALAERLLERDTQNPPGATRALMEWLADYLAEAGVDASLTAIDPAKPNLTATIPGAGEGTLCLLGHADTVPFEPEQWTRDPLGERDGDRLYGRGATDMKGPLAAMVTAFLAYPRTDTVPPVDLQLVVVSDEETGGDAGLPSVLEDIEADWCVIGETTCGPDRHSVTVADRGSIWLTMAATGEAAHGSRPMLGVNAIDTLYEGIETLRDRFGSRPLDVDAALDPIIAESVEYYEPTLGRTAARDLFEHPSINLGTIEGGETINAVPQAARAEIDIRLTASVDTRAVLTEIRECADACPGVAVADVSWSVGSYEPVDSPLVEAVATVAGDVADERVYRRSATGGGDAKTLRQAGIPTVEFAFGTTTAHAVDEYTTAWALTGNAEVYARLPAAVSDGG